MPCNQIFRSVLIGLILVALAGFTAIAQSPKTGPVARGESQPQKLNARSSPAERRNAEAESRIRQLRSELIRTPNDPILLNNIGVEYIALGRYNDALAVIEQSLAANTGYSETYLNLAAAYSHLGRLEEALSAAGKSVALDQRNSSSRKLVCQLNLELEKNEEAAGCYRRFVDDFGESTDISIDLGRSLTKIGKFDEAIGVLSRANAVKANDTRVLNALAVAQYGKGEIPAAIKTIRKAIEVEPAQHKLRFNLAMFCLASGDRAAALKQYKLLKRDAPELAQAFYEILYRDDVVDARNTGAKE